MAAKYESKKNRFKNIIKHLESSGGKNLNHETIQSGINAGQTAGGAYGILPNTLNNFVNTSRNKGEAIDPRLDAMTQLPSEVVTDILNEDRELDEKAAELGMGQVLNRAGWDEEKAAYGWNQGHNRNFKEMANETIKDHEYVRKYREKMGEHPDITPKSRKMDSKFFQNIKKLLGNDENG